MSVERGEERIILRLVILRAAKTPTNVGVFAKSKDPFERDITHDSGRSSLH
jgi:hypothetical protein